jgi:GPH family glycoside/pentoside/hexuronide:cation symporter
MMIVLNLGLGMNPALVGLLGAIPRLFDALIDPLMGYISDNAHTRWGRRRPFIFAGAIASGVSSRCCGNSRAVTERLSTSGTS